MLGRIFPNTDPNKVPIAHQKYGTTDNPKKNDLDISSFVIATANISSVMPKAAIIRCGVWNLSSSFCERDMPISEYRILMTS